MDARANMRAMLENARQTIRNRAANTGGALAKTKVATIASASPHTRKPAAPQSTEVAEGLHFTKDTTSGTEGAEAANALNAKDNRMQFVQHYYRLLCAFIEDKSKYELELPNLSALDRVVVHSLAEKCNLSHESAGSRSDRVMHLKKDILFFQHPEAAQQVNLDEIIEKVSWKESKYQIRYVRSANPAQVAVGDIGSYADEDALHKIERFRRATDEYRHAIDMGYTQQELLLAEAGGEPGEAGEANCTIPANVEEILSRLDPAVPAITAGPSDGAPEASTSSSSSTAARAMRAAKTTTTTTTTTTVFDEVCRACGSRLRLDGPPQGWKCSHYCAHCTRQTIWSLEEVRVQETNMVKRGRDDVEAAGTEGRRQKKRPQWESAVEEIDREEDERDDTAQWHEAEGEVISDDEGEDDDLTAEDVMEVAAANDFSAKDVNWLREFASHAMGHVGRRIAFCIDFSDLEGMPIFARYDNAATSTTDEKGEEAPAVWYVVLREVRDLALSVSDLLRELLNDAFVSPSAEKPADAPAVEEIQTEAAEKRAMEHVGVALPNLSVYGTECAVVCQLRPFVRTASVPRMHVKPEALQALRQRYGERHVFASQSLRAAVAHVAKSTSE
jgi:hypothetical protein